MKLHHLQTYIDPRTNVYTIWPRMTHSAW